MMPLWTFTHSHTLAIAGHGDDGRPCAVGIQRNNTATDSGPEQGNDSALGLSQASYQSLQPMRERADEANAAFKSP